MKKSDIKPAHFRVTGVFDGEIEEEIESRLAGDNYIREFKKMADTDAICGAVMLAVTKTFQAINWVAVNDSKGVLARSLENINWLERIGEICTFLIYGFALTEVVLKQDGKLYVWDAMYFRPQSTIAKWYFDDRGNILSVDQFAYSKGTTANIKMSKCLHFTTFKSLNNPRGKSLFRNAYRDWYYRTNIEKIEAIGLERDLTGLPVLTPDEDTLLFDDQGHLTKVGQWAWELVRNVKRNSQEGIVIPPGWEFELQGSPGQRQFDLDKIVSRYDAKIAMSMLSQFLTLGVINSSGSFALSREQSNLFYRAIEGFANMIANVVNTQFIGSPALGLLNDVEKPKLVPVGVDKPTLDDLASFLGRLLKFGVITPDDELESYLRKKASLPEKDERTSRPLPAASGAITPDKEEDDEKKKDPEEDE